MLYGYDIDTLGYTHVISADERRYRCTMAVAVLQLGGVASLISSNERL